MDQNRVANFSGTGAAIDDEKKKQKELSDSMRSIGEGRVKDGKTHRRKRRPRAEKKCEELEVLLPGSAEKRTKNPLQPASQ